MTRYDGSEMQRNNEVLSGKRVVVLGGSSGVGLAAAQRLVKAGASVIVLGRSKERLDSAVEKLGIGSVAYEVDMMNEVSIDAVFAKIGPLDHLLLTAAMDEQQNRAPFRDMKNEQAQRSWSKFWGYFHAARAASPRIAQNGSMTLFSGASAFNPPKEGMAVLAAVNGAVASFSRALAAELAPVRVNAVAPGVIDTAVWGEDGNPQRQGLREWAEKMLPAGRFGTADDIAEAVLFLMTNPYTTGTILHIDGGLSLL